MYDPKFWVNESRRRQQRLEREARNDRMANELRRRVGYAGLLGLVVREALEVARARMAPQADSGVTAFRAKPASADDTVSPILAEADEIVRAYAESSQDSSSHA